jgi:amino-acid N-acetyltransferase
MSEAIPSPATPLPAIETAAVSDVDAVFALIDEASRTTTVLARDRENLRASLRDFLVARQEGRVVACGALSLFASDLAEVRSLVVRPEWRGHGLGGRLVRALTREAQRLGIRRLFALTDNPAFFERLGFCRVDRATLPQKAWSECVHCPKFFNCQEEAVEVALGVPDAPDSETPVHEA